MNKEIFLIHELARRSGATIRTIRYYTDEGILPQPLMQGKYAAYTEDHLNRLELIRQMKDAFLPLKRIKEVMASLSDEDVLRQLNEKTITYQPGEGVIRSNAPEEHPGALGYINRVMESQAEFRTHVHYGPPLHSTLTPKKQEQSTNPANVTLPDAPAPRKLMESEHARARILSEPKTQAQMESWMRITLAPGVELHLHSRQSHRLQEKINQLIEFAQTLFKEP